MAEHEDRDPDPTPARCYSTRILSPFRGTLHVVSVEHGDAEITDGLHWVLYVAHHAIAAPLVAGVSVTLLVGFIMISVGPAGRETA